MAKLYTVEELLANTTHDPIKGCMVWNGFKRGQSGYAGVCHDGKQWAASNLILYLLGKLKPGEKALHECDNPPCINPDHLFSGTQRVNMEDMAAKGRASQGGIYILTDDEVAAIRSKYVRGQYTMARLAKEFGVSRLTIRNVITRQTYQHLP
jgi:hypothetical protein